VVSTRLHDLLCLPPLRKQQQHSLFLTPILAVPSLSAHHSLGLLSMNLLRRSQLLLLPRGAMDIVKATKATRRPLRCLPQPR
jgi:hypothetical protein